MFEFGVVVLALENFPLEGLDGLKVNDFLCLTLSQDELCFELAKLLLLFSFLLETQMVLFLEDGKVV